jgi:hypothetical protein
MNQVVQDPELAESRRYEKTKTKKRNLGASGFSRALTIPEPA